MTNCEKDSLLGQTVLPPEPSQFLEKEFIFAPPFILTLYFFKSVVMLEPSVLDGLEGILFPSVNFYSAFLILKSIEPMQEKYSVRLIWR